jgi:myo-inositol-1(or 4)-monophosphatase
MQADLAFITQLAQSTGEILLDQFRAKDIDPRLKSDHTIVTNADLAADKFIRTAILSAYPNDSVLSEEASTVFPESGGATWVIDPLDGTSNFSLGLHYWGTSIARVVNGMPQLAGLCFPALGETYTAVCDGGAFLNGHRLDVNDASRTPPIAVYTCDSRLHRQYNVKIRIKPRILGSAAYNYCAVAAGISKLGIETSPHLWDIAASWLVVHEAGGHFRTWDSPVFPASPGQDYAQKIFPASCAATVDLLDEADQKISKK